LPIALHVSVGSCEGTIEIVFESSTHLYYKKGEKEKKHPVSH